MKDFNYKELNKINYDTIAATILNIGITYFRLGDYQRAEKNITKALNLYTWSCGEKVVKYRKTLLYLC